MTDWSSEPYRSTAEWRPSSLGRPVPQGLFHPARKQSQSSPPSGLPSSKRAQLILRLSPRLRALHGD